MLRRCLSALLLMPLTVAFMSCAPPMQDVTLYFYNESDLGNAVFDDPVPVRRTVSRVNAMDSALQQLFVGPTDAERQAGARTSNDLTALGSLYLDVRQEGDAAIVNFRSEALSILNSAAARQFMVKSSIRATLLQFPQIHDVQYAIDGEIFVDWDA